MPCPDLHLPHVFPNHQAPLGSSSYFTSTCSHYTCGPSVFFTADIHVWIIIILYKWLPSRRHAPHTSFVMWEHCKRTLQNIKKLFNLGKSVTEWITLYVRVHPCVNMYGCPVQLLSDPSFLPALLKPKLHGAAYGKGIYLSPISSISFGYSGRNGSFLAIQTPTGPPLSLFFPTMSTLCVCNMAWSSSWDTPFSRVGDLHVTLLWCGVLCVHFGCRAWGLWACVPPSIPTIICGFVKQGCLWTCVCVCYFVVRWLFMWFSFCGVEETFIWHSAPTVVGWFGRGCVIRPSDCQCPNVMNGYSISESHLSWYPLDIRLLCYISKCLEY